MEKELFEFAIADLNLVFEVYILQSNHWQYMSNIWILCAPSVLLMFLRLFWYEIKVLIEWVKINGLYKASITKVSCLTTIWRFLVQFFVQFTQNFFFITFSLRRCWHCCIKVSFFDIGFHGFIEYLIDQDAVFNWSRCHRAFFIRLFDQVFQYFKPL